MSLATVENTKVHQLQTSSFDWSAIEKTAKDLYGKKLTAPDWEFFKLVCQQTELNPILKQIYPVVRGNTMTIQTSIDGFRLMAERTRKYAPGKESAFTYDKDGKLLSATSYVKKLTPDGTWHEIAYTAFLSEYMVDSGALWKKMPHVMLSKCAEAAALRKAFPAELSKVYTPDEMQQADEITQEMWARLDSLVLQLKDRESVNELATKLHAKDIYSIEFKDYDRAIRSIEKKIKEQDDETSRT